MPMGGIVVKMACCSLWCFSAIYGPSSVLSDGVGENDVGSAQCNPPPISLQSLVGCSRGDCLAWMPTGLAASGISKPGSGSAIGEFEKGCT